MFVVFDLDGTLALTEHRSHFLTGETKDWRSFYAACDGDEPCVPLLTIMETLVRCEHRVEIWTGRSDEVAAKTRMWFVKHGWDYPVVRMRAEGDHTPDDILKKRWLDECGENRPDLVFEDRARMVEMFREQGIVCCQVAPGDF